MAKPLVFSFVNEQRRFLFLLLGFLTFLTIVSGGIILSISTAVGRFSANLERTGIIQVTPGGNLDAALKIANEQPGIVSVRTVDRSESMRLLQNWLSGGEALASHIPTIIQVQTQTSAQLDNIAKHAGEARLRFTYGRNASPDRMTGIRIIGLAFFIFIAILCALAVCIAHSVKNIITIHKREIEILNQIGATPKYITWQIQMAMLDIGGKAILAGWLSGAAMLILVNGLSRGAHVGLLANMGMRGTDWLMTVILALTLVILTVWVTRRRALKILAKQ